MQSSSIGKAVLWGEGGPIDYCGGFKGLHKTEPLGNDCGRPALLVGIDSVIQVHASPTPGYNGTRYGIFHPSSRA
jgi:hypothetical protein